MLQVDQLTMSLGERQWHLDLTLETHAVYALLGRSGSGKSTLLNLIAGFLEPDSGDIRWNGKSLLHLKPSQRPVNTLFQQHNLFTHLNVQQNIGLGLSPGLKLSDTDRQRIDKVLHDVGLDEYGAKMPDTLSGGEQQRVALARCILRQRPVLLLDEPFSALDTTTRQEMIGLLKTVLRSYQPCVLMVTHDEDDAHSMEARVLRMQNGRVAQSDG